MVLEVNNTFDERRLYFLKNTDLQPSETAKGGTVNDCETPLQQLSPKMSHQKNIEATVRFKKTWPKDFHVSPFNSRKGAYALTAYDLFSPQLHGEGTIDNTITLNSSKSHAKIIARIFSTEAPIDPSSLTWWQRLRFVTSWWWVGLVTFPRIVREAGKLFFRRKLHVWYRPEILEDSIGRRATNDEL